MPCEHRDRFGRVDHRPAAQSDDAVATLALINLERPFDARHGRIFRYFVEDHDIVAARHGFLHPRQHTTGDEALVGQDQRPRDA